MKKFLKPQNTILTKNITQEGDRISENLRNNYKGPLSPDSFSQRIRINDFRSSRRLTFICILLTKEQGEKFRFSFDLSALTTTMMLRIAPPVLPRSFAAF